MLAEGDPVPRYRLLETTRVYALERLGDAGETASSMRLHAEALLRCLQAKQLLRAVAAAEIDNLRAALAWTATAQGCNELAVSLAAHSLRVWNATAQLHEGLEHALALKGRLSDDLPPTLVARFWLTVAELGQYTTRRESYDAAVEQTKQVLRAEQRARYEELLKRHSWGPGGNNAGRDRHPSSTTRPSGETRAIVAASQPAERATNP